MAGSGCIFGLTLVQNRVTHPLSTDYELRWLVYDGRGEVARTQGVWGAEGISGRVKFLPLAWAGMPKTSFRKNSDSPHICPY
jgi:hypothetical protein